MLFYLDKILAKQGIAKCIAVSEIEISQEELEARKKCFNVQEILIYEGIDIPHKFKYNESLDNIEELIELEEIAPRMLSEEIQEVESDFDEEVEVDPEKQYFYLDKAYADKFHKSQVIAVFPKPLKNPNQYFQKEVYSHFGKDIPFYISIDEGNIIREATEYEKYQRGQRKLEDYEIVENDSIKKVEIPENTVKPFWNKELEKVEDIATEEEVKEYYYNKINSYKSQILDTGYNYDGHQQRCREKDLALLGNAVAAFNDSQTFSMINRLSENPSEKTINWAFNDNDISLMTETDLRKMRLAGAEFINNVYAIEAQLKSMEANKNIKIDEFISKINEISSVKCYEI